MFFLAGYLAETADVIEHAKPWSVRANLKYLGPLFIGGAHRRFSWCSASRHGDLAAPRSDAYATRRIDLVIGGWRFSRCGAVGNASLPVRTDPIAVWNNPFSIAVPDTNHRKRTMRLPRACSEPGSAWTSRLHPDVGELCVCGLFGSSFNQRGVVIAFSCYSCVVSECGEADPIC